MHEGVPVNYYITSIVLLLDSAEKGRPATRGW